MPTSAGHAIETGMGQSITAIRHRFKRDPDLVCYANGRWEKTLCDQQNHEHKPVTQRWADVTCPACLDKRSI